MERGGQEEATWRPSDGGIGVRKESLVGRKEVGSGA